MSKLIDLNGLTYFWEKAKTLLSEKIVTSGGTGAAYTATVPGITELKAGVKFTMIPHTVSTTLTPTLNVNGLGAKKLRQPLTINTGTVTTASSTSWITANKPVTVRYDGEQWEIDIPRPTASTLYGTVEIANGGTGANNAADARANLGIDSALESKAEVQTLTTAEYNALTTKSANTLYMLTDDTTEEDMEAQIANKADKKVPSAANNVALLDANGNLADSGKALTPAAIGASASGHTHSNATTSNAGFMSAADKAKLDGVAEGANQTVVDSELSDTSTNPVQNKIVKAALDGKATATHTHSATDITSGVFPIERGGTGATTAEAARTALGVVHMDRTATLTNSESELENTLLEHLNSMSNNEVKFFEVRDSYANTFGFGGGYMCMLYRADGNYASAILFGDSINKAMARKNYYSGKWKPTEWIIFNAYKGHEFLTTERYLGNPVYCKVIDCGSIKDGATVNVGYRILRHCGYLASTAMPLGNISGYYAYSENTPENSLTLRTDSRSDGYGTWDGNWYEKVWYIK